MVLGAGGLVLWLWILHGAGDSVLRRCVAFGAWFGAAIALLHFWRKRVVGALQWNGSCWRLDIERTGLVEPLEGALWVRLDLQNHLWVCLVGREGRSVWLWLDRKGAPERWGDLRRAVYSRPRPEASRAGEPAVPRSP